MRYLRLATLLVVMLLCACNRARKAIAISTPSFDTAIKRGERMNDSGYRDVGLAYVIAAHKATQGLTITDEMNFYGYCAEVFRRDHKDYDRYMQYADTMLAMLDRNNQQRVFPDRYIQVYNMKAEGLFSKGLYLEAYDYYYKAKKLAGETSDSCALSKYSYSMGMVLYRQQKFVDAAADFRQSYQESAACEDIFTYFYHRQEVLDNIGLCYYNAKQYDSAMLYFNKALAYIDANYMRFDKRESVYISAKAVVFGNMAGVYLDQGKYDTARQLLEKSININLQKGYTNNDALLDQTRLATAYYHKKDMAGMKQVLDLIHAELDTIQDNDHKVARYWNKMMWQYYADQNDSMHAYRYLHDHEIMMDSFMAQNKLLLATDAEGRIRNIERQAHIDLLKKSNEQDRLYFIIAAIVACMAIIIIAIVSRNMRKTRRNLRALTSLNDQVNDQKEKLQTALTALELKDKDRSRILRSVAHDVMNPIAAIMAFIDILLTGDETYTEEQTEIFSLIKEACNNSLTLSRDILEASADHTRITKEKVNINKLVASSVDLLNFRAQEKKQRLTITAEDGNVEAYINKEKIWRVINNLLGNAIKFSHTGSEIVINIVTASGSVDISVKDNGIGIPEKNKPHVFDMFTDAKSLGTSGEAPHGLGLSISLQIARAHNGNIWFDSTEGKGTTFHLILPLKDTL